MGLFLRSSSVPANNPPSITTSAPPAIAFCKITCLFYAAVRYHGYSCFSCNLCTFNNCSHLRNTDSGDYPCSTDRAGSMPILCSPSGFDQIKCSSRSSHITRDQINVKFIFIFLTIFSTPSEWPWAVSTTITSAPEETSSLFYPVHSIRCNPDSCANSQSAVFVFTGIGKLFLFCISLKVISPF